MNDLETRQIRANEARQFMQNPLFRQAFEGVKADLDAETLACDRDNKEKAHRLMIAHQLLNAVRREIERRAEDGDFAEFQMKELEQRRGMARIFRR